MKKNYILCLTVLTISALVLAGCNEFLKDVPDGTVVDDVPVVLPTSIAYGVKTLIHLDRLQHGHVVR